MRECPDEKPKYTPEIRDRAVQLLIESEKDYLSTWGAITTIAPKIGCTPETLRSWHQTFESTEFNQSTVTFRSRTH